GKKMRMIEASVFVGVSVDGFIARTDGALDWLPPGDVELHGYDEFMATVDALVIGRKTFETVLTFDAWPYGAKPVFALSSSPLAPAPPELWWNICQGIRPKSCRGLPIAASGMFTWTAGSLFSGFFGPG